MTHGLLAQLKRTVRELERDLGLARYTECERDIICFGQRPVGEVGFEVSQLLEDDFMQSYSRPTVYRGLKTLVDAGVLQRIGSVGSGSYRLVLDDPINEAAVELGRRPSGSTTA